ncbi:predicted protein [Ostreococcus lucimarinus CCE9901]|jgi:uncharacterized coiled-coil protein SlyX|uniref:Uncharacterized protein n=1 Tax=Ostreococcus lucimarinus (strain CCE9901) TaxID=436017 RepID=A4S8D2_OSTLU|nr:predicted protein [Ostreococcus lucimarinus CCE9901]ABP00043.1 predicted protein [Ostreococcus lucimarinus CCE9901]|tara:strand:- start:1375 stop:3687 length:2313 start_codon:yes stop_codon:yes gene_type:complete|eukprot:XP_001421749.1 predicted protein [Ostreococcus lucimarinus CCE9901]
MADEDVRELATYGTALGTPERIESLERFVNLRALRAHACEITSMDCEAFAVLTRLEELDLSSNAIAEARGLEKLTRLRTLNLASNALESTRGFERASTTLERVNISNNKIKSLSGFARSDGAEWGIRALDARGNALESFQAARALSELTRLESLRLKMEEGSVIGKETNGMCDVPSYRITMASLVPWLTHLDGVVLSVETCTKAMTKTLDASATTAPGRSSMTPPHAEQFSRTPQRGDRSGEKRQTAFQAADESVKSRGVQVNGDAAKRAIDFDQQVVRRVREESSQTEAPLMKDVETQKSAMSNVTIDDASERRLREEVETLRRELTKASQAIERASRNEEAAQLRVSELETILQEVRTESAENLANLKAMYMDEQNALLNDRVNEARKESTVYAQAIEENARLKERISSMEREQHAHEEAAIASNEKIAAQEAGLSEMRELLRVACAERAEAETLNEELAQVVESQRDQLEGYAKTREMVVLMEEELERARGAVIDRESTHATIKSAKVAALKAERSAAAREEKAREREELAERLIRDVEALQLKLESADESTKIKNDMLQHQNQLIKSLKDEAVRLREQKAESLRTHDARMVEAEARMNAMSEECRSLVQQVESMEMNITELENALADSEVDHASYEHAISKANNAVAERDRIIVHMESQIKRLTQTLETSDSIEKAKSKELQHQLEELSEQLAIARDKASMYETRAIAIREESDAIVREAYERVDDVEHEMRSLLLDMATEKKANRDRMAQIGRLLQEGDIPLALD